MCVIDFYEAKHKRNAGTPRCHPFWEVSISLSLSRTAVLQIPTAHYQSGLGLGQTACQGPTSLPVYELLIPILSQL